MPLAPEYQAMFAELAAQSGPKITDLSPSEGRELYRLMRPRTDTPAIGHVEDARIDAGRHEIPVRIYQPEGEGPFPVLVYFHGGGWVIGDLDTADTVCRGLSRGAELVVVSVDYRLAPEHPYPVAVEDALAATRWAAENRERLGGNGRLAVGGESAGGNLAAVVAQQFTGSDGPAIDLQVLAYPVVDHDLARPSYTENGEGYLLETDTMRWFWDHYCPDVERRNEPMASPLRAGQLAGLPPALVITAEFDPLRDEGAAYAEALERAGVPVQLLNFDGLVHDFLATSELFECSRSAFDSVVRAIRQALT